MGQRAERAAPNGLVSGGQHLAKDELEARVAMAAGGFEAIGLGQGDCIAILLRNDVPFLVASLAAARLGAYAVPVNWHFTPDEVGYVLRDCSAKVLIGHEDLLNACWTALPAALQVLTVAVPSEIREAYGLETRLGQAGAKSLALRDSTDWDDWLARSRPYAGPSRPPTQSMIYTSGTTGRPKGVRRQPATPEQELAIARSRRALYGFGPGVRAMVPGPLYHSAPNGFALRALSATDLLVLLPKFEPEAFLAAVERHRITTLFMVPTMFVRLLKLPEATRRRYDISSLRFVMHAAAPCPADVKRQMIDWWGPIIWEFYGGTEIGALTMISAEESLRKPGSVGRLVDGASIAILDETGNPVRQGEPGEIYCKLDFYPDFTYHNLPERRAEVERNGMITAGDVGYFDADGYLFLCDRRRDMVISGGVNIYPAEIEAVAVTLPGVKDCAVFGIPDAEFGERLMAYVEPMDDVTLDPAEVRAALAACLASYKVPRVIEIHHNLPREDSGKIFKRRLRDPYWQGVGRRI